MDETKIYTTEDLRRELYTAIMELTHEERKELLAMWKQHMEMKKEVAGNG